MTKALAGKVRKKPRLTSVPSIESIANEDETSDSLSEEEFSRLLDFVRLWYVENGSSIRPFLDNFRDQLLGPEEDDVQVKGKAFEMRNAASKSSTLTPLEVILGCEAKKEGGSFEDSLSPSPSGTSISNDEKNERLAAILYQPVKNQIGQWINEPDCWSWEVKLAVATAELRDSFKETRRRAAKQGIPMPEFEDEDPHGVEQ